MTENSRAVAAAIVGAVVGGLAGYLFFTDAAGGCADSSSRRSTTSRASSTASARTVNKAAGVANEGWKLLNEALGDSGQAAPRYPNSASDSLRSEAIDMAGELGTTNLLLGIMAAVSVLEALVIIGIGVAGFMVYRQRDGTRRRASRRGRSRRR